MSKSRNIADIGSNDVLDTNANGIDVTGTVAADGLTVGSSTLTESASDLTINATDDLFLQANSDDAITVNTNLGDLDFIRLYQRAGEALQVNCATGDISFYEDTGTTPKLFWDASAESLGIGTSSPNYRAHFHTASTGSSTYLHITNGDCGTTTADGFIIGVATGASPDAYVINKENSNLILVTNNSEAARIDSSGRVLVGATSFQYNTQGVGLRGDTDYSYFTSSGSAPLLVNRKTNDGDVIRIYRDTTQVGAIGTKGDDLTIGSGDTGLRMQADIDAIYPFNVSTNLNVVDTTDLGTSAVRFKDLYLSGGVYLGGTVAANKLDDYEEGTWTPTFYGSTTAGTYSINAAEGKYTKIGDIVHASFRLADISTVSAGSGNVVVGGLPFTSSNDNSVSLQSVWLSRWNISTDSDYQIFLGSNVNAFNIYRMTSGVSGTGQVLQVTDKASNLADIYTLFTYRTDS